MNVAEVKRIEIQNFSKSMEYFLMWLGSLPHREKNVASNDDLFSVSISVAEKRISSSEVISKHGNQSPGPPEVKLVDTIMLLGADRSTIQRIAQSFKSLSNACSDEVAVPLEINEVEPKPPDKPGEGFEVLLRGVFGDAVQSEPSDPKNAAKSDSKKNSKKR
jgi:hypothetical protein